MFSHDENSAGYSACDTKYGDCQNILASQLTSPSQLPWYSAYRNSITSVNIENGIKPRGLRYCFNGMQKIRSLDLSKVDTSNCLSIFSMLGGTYLSNVTYGSKFVAPEKQYDNLFGYSSSYMPAYNSVITAPRPSWMTWDVVYHISLNNSSETLTYNNADKIYIAANNPTSLSIAEYRDNVGLSPNITNLGIYSNPVGSGEKQSWGMQELNLVSNGDKRVNISCSDDREVLVRFTKVVSSY